MLKRIPKKNFSLTWAESKAPISKNVWYFSGLCSFLPNFSRVSGLVMVSDFQPIVKPEKRQKLGMGWKPNFWRFSGLIAVTGFKTDSNARLSTLTLIFLRPRQPWKCTPTEADIKNWANKIYCKHLICAIRLNRTRKKNPRKCALTFELWNHMKFLSRLCCICNVHIYENAHAHFALNAYILRKNIMNKLIWNCEKQKTI